MSRQTLIVVLVAASAYLMLNQDNGATAGDDSANVLEDGADTIMGMINGWPSGSEPYQQTITDAASRAGMPPAILAWQLWKESRYNPAIIDGTKRSRVGAMGIAQFMPDTAQEWCGGEAGALDPESAIPACANYMAWLYNKTGSWEAALAAYNWGIGNVTRKGLAAAPAETVDYYTTIMSKAGLSAGSIA